MGRPKKIVEVVEKVEGVEVEAPSSKGMVSELIGSKGRFRLFKVGEEYKIETEFGVLISTLNDLSAAEKLLSDLTR
jgi:hypothetical protein